MHNLLRKQIIIAIAILMGVVNNNMFAQFNKEIHRPQSDELAYFFGLTLGYNNSYLSTEKSNKFIYSDTVLVAEPELTRGIAMGLHATARINKHLQARFNPQLILGGVRNFNFKLKNGYFDDVTSQTLPTTLLSFPVMLKFSSDRIDNFKSYILFGGKFDIDLSSNAAARQQDKYIKLSPYDYGLEAGVGFNLYLRYFTLSPELKVGYGLNNILDRDPSNKYSAVFNALHTRMFMLSLHFEQ